MLSHEQISITTGDGECPAYVCTPGTGKKAPAIVMYMDAAGIRPALISMAERLSGAGYVVLLPDLFYRFGPYGPFDPREVFKEDFRAILGPLFAATGNAKAAADTEAFLAYLDTRTALMARRWARLVSAWGAAWRLRQRALGQIDSPPSRAFTAVI